MNDKINEIAQWLYKKVKTEYYLYQEFVVVEIMKKYGKEYLYINQNGNYAINKDVLKQFRKISQDVVWLRGERCWKIREKHDVAGRSQDL